jgi:type IV secretion system protein VirD4
MNPSIFHDAYPMHTRLKLFKEWGITFGKPYEIAEQSARVVEYADRRRVEEEIFRRHAACEEVPEEAAASGDPAYTPTQAITFEEFVQPKGPERK